MNINNNKFIKIINTVEDSLLVFLLSTMIILAVYQIISRNIFSAGVVWIDPLLRTLVLWVGLAGAVVATRSDNHIRIDIFAKYFPLSVQRYMLRIVYLFTLSICLLIGWHAARFVINEYEYGTIAFAGIPAWLAGIIIPISFTLIAIRYALLLFSPHIHKTDKSTDN